MTLSILLIEDDQRFADRLVRFLRKEEHDVEHASTGEQGVDVLARSAPDLVLLDLVLPGIDGLETLERIRKVRESVSVIVLTAHASVSTAVEAMRLGALDYLTKPLDLDALCVKLSRVQQLHGLRSDLEYALEREQRGSGLDNFVGDCPQMREVFEKLREVAKTDNTTVLVTGESGTGKELVARAVHSLSARRKKPLMQINCAAIPLTLLESELFGHERGAFTSADQTKKGLLELADGGTLLLDEIGDMAYELQSKFLRVLQERQFRRVGGTRDLVFDVRIIAATNQDLDQLAEERRFRQDLMYRLRVFGVELPPLRERGDDILKLAYAFVRQYAQEFRKPLRGLDSDAERALLAYSFPGNVRELRNMIEQAAILAKGELLTRNLLRLTQRDPAIPDAAPAIGPSLSLDALGSQPLLEAERILIKEAIQRSRGNKRQAAELLGISRFALQRKLEKLALGMLDLGDD
jgi:two-component system, NtrC family, response regulator AtoC